MKNLFLTAIFLYLLISLPAHPCTAFYITDGSNILFANNEDHFNPETRIWFVPGDNHNYGAVYFGYDDMYSQGGMNEKGLFYDGFWVAESEHDQADLEMDCPREWFDSILKKCATVEEAIIIIKKHQLHVCTMGKLMYGDAMGNSVIIGNGAIVHKTGNYQISTNFFDSKVKKDEITCVRYLTAEKMIKTDPGPTVDNCRNILKAVSVRETQYSNIFDPKNLHVYLYHYHNFDQVYFFNLKEELKKGAKVLTIASLFPKNRNFYNQFYKKRTPLNTGALKVLLLTLKYIFLILPFGFFIFRYQLKKTAADNKGVDPRFFTLVQISFSLAGLLSAVFITAMFRFNSLFWVGAPESLEGFSLKGILINNIPALLIAIFLLLSIILTVVFKEKLWTRVSRSIFLMTQFIFLIFICLMFYWNQIRFYFL